MNSSIKEAVIAILMAASFQENDRKKLLLACEGIGFMLSDQRERTAAAAKAKQAAARELLGLPTPEDGIAWADVPQLYKEIVYEVLLRHQASYSHRAHQNAVNGLLELWRRGQAVSSGCYQAALSLGYQEMVDDDRVPDSMDGTGQNMIMSATMKDGRWKAKWLEAGAIAAEKSFKKKHKKKHKKG